MAPAMVRQALCAVLALSAVPACRGSSKVDSDLDSVVMMQMQEMYAEGRDLEVEDSLQNEVQEGQLETEEAIDEDPYMDVIRGLSWEDTIGLTFGFSQLDDENMEKAVKADDDETFDMELDPEHAQLVNDIMDEEEKAAELVDKVNNIPPASHAIINTSMDDYIYTSGYARSVADHMLRTKFGKSARRSTVVQTPEVVKEDLDNATNSSNRTRPKKPHKNNPKGWDWLKKVWDVKKSGMPVPPPFRLPHEVIMGWEFIHKEKFSNGTRCQRAVQIGGNRYKKLYHMFMMACYKFGVHPMDCNPKKVKFIVKRNFRQLKWMKSAEFYGLSANETLFVMYNDKATHVGADLDGILRAIKYERDKRKLEQLIKAFNRYKNNGAYRTAVKGFDKGWQELKDYVQEADDQINEGVKEALTKVLGDYGVGPYAKDDSPFRGIDPFDHGPLEGAKPLGKDPLTGIVDWLKEQWEGLKGNNEEAAGDLNGLFGDKGTQTITDSIKEGLDNYGENAAQAGTDSLSNNARR